MTWGKMGLNRRGLLMAPLLWAAAIRSGQAATEDRMQPDDSWRFFTDQVMGGVSTGGVRILTEGGVTFLRLAGRVSTENRGGFIQMRHDLSAPPPEGTGGLWLRARGNGQRYFVHLRTAGTLLPWQYYQAGFEVTGDWAEYRLPLETFTASGALLRRVPEDRALTSVAVVAYGRDHEALIDVAEVGFF